MKNVQTVDGKSSQAKYTQTRAALVIALVIFSVGLMVRDIAAQEESGMQSPPLTSVNPSGIPLGPFLFTPSFEAIFEHKDNIFLTPDNEVDDNVYVLRPRLMLELPVYQNYLRLVYTPQYREYLDHGDLLQENMAHFLDAEFYLDTASGVEWNVRNRFVMGALEVPEVDPGRELAWGNEPFTKDDFDTEMRYFFTDSDGVGVNFRYTFVEYDDAEDAFFYDYDGYVAGLSYHRQMTPLLRLYVQLNRHENDVDNTAAFRGYSANEARVGISGEVTPTFETNFYVGYHDRQFDSVGDGIDRDFSNVILNGGIDWTLSPAQTVQLNVSYQPYQSNFLNAAYYDGTKLEFAYNIGFVETVYGSFGGFYQKNAYPSEVFIDRDDTIWRVNVAVGLHLTDFISLRGQVRHEERDSNLDEFDYDANTYMLNLIVGY